MIWRIIGAIIGWVWSGSLSGAALGFIFGYFVDSTLRRFGGGGDPRELVSKNSFLYTLVAILAKMSKAEGRVSKSEIQVVNRIFQQSMGLRGRQLKAVQAIFMHEKDSATTVEEYLHDYKRLSQQLSSSNDLHELLYYCLQEIARADGQMSPEEREILILAEQILDLHSHSEERATPRSGAMTRAAAAEILEVRATASADEIRSAYRKKCASMHPDKLISKGLPKELVELAEQKMAQYNKARDILLG